MSTSWGRRLVIVVLHEMRAPISDKMTKISDGRACVARKIGHCRRFVIEHFFIILDVFKFQTLK